MTFDNFLKQIDDTFWEHQASRAKVSAANQWRYGQTVMNVLYNVWPEKYNEIRGTDIDCFYSNAKVEDVLDKLEKEWYDKNI